MAVELVVKQMDLASRVVDDERRILEIVGTTPAVDRAGESIAVDGWVLDGWLKNPVIMFGHDYSSRPIAKGLTVKRGDGALTFRFQFPTEEQAGEWYGFSDSVFRLMKSGFLNASSVGFRPLEWKDDGDADGKSAPVRTYTKQELYELSIVPVPCNPEALANGIEAGMLKACDRTAIETMLQRETAGAEGLKNLSWAERIEGVLEGWTPTIIDDPPDDGEPGDDDVDEIDEDDVDDIEEEDDLSLRDVYDEVAILTDAVQTLADHVRTTLKRIGSMQQKASQGAGGDTVTVGAPAADVDIDTWVEAELETLRARRGGKN